jgi:cytochrome o ubiquinol oxidase subunit 2
MHFIARASAESDFNAWVSDVKRSPERLSQATYDALSQPSENNPVTLYSSVDANLYDTIVMKYMMPAGGGETHNHGTDY